MNLKLKLINHIDTYKIRQAILWPDMPIENIKLPEDEQALHIGAFIGKLHVGVISLFNDKDIFQFRKLAVLKDFQGKGIGKELVNNCILRASKKESIMLWCNARQESMGFYKKLGFSIDPTIFHKSEIIYQKAYIKYPYTALTMKK